MARKILIGGILFSLLAVILGAFGSHALKDILEQNGRSQTFETAVQYQMFHALALLILGVWALKKPNKHLAYSAFLFSFGILFFSGSLYLLSIFNITVLGVITPIGGICFIAAWILLLNHALRSSY
jgi:uncharacterized membrane protein YgdD (TMEM256/DUF423 family)